MQRTLIKLADTAKAAMQRTATHELKKDNSYILMSHVNPRFLQKMTEVMTHFEKKFDWFSPTSLTPHVTIGYSNPTTDKTDSASDPELLQATLVKETDKLLNSNIKKSIFLLPAEIHIAPTGWIILALQQIKVDEDMPDLQKFHEQYVDMIEHNEFNQSFKNPHFIRKGYKAHISIGLIKSNTPEEMPAAVKTVNDLLSKDNGATRNAMLQLCLSTLPVVNLFKFDLMNNLKKESLLPRPFEAKRRDFGITAVEQASDKIYLQFSEEKPAQKCADFLQALGIYAKGKPLAKQTFKDKVALELSQDEYAAISGIIDKCKPI